MAWEETSHGQVEVEICECNEEEIEVLVEDVASQLVMAGEPVEEEICSSTALEEGRHMKALLQPK